MNSVVQEHWLQPSQLHLLNNINDNFVSYRKSSMERNVCSGLLKGRPFGVVGVLWRKELAPFVKCYDCDPDNVESLQ